MRIPLAVSIKSRDGTLDKGPKLVNVYTETKNYRTKAFSRPGVSTITSSLAGFGNGLFNDDDELLGVNNSTLFRHASTSASSYASSFEFAQTYSTWTAPIPFYLNDEFYHQNTDAVSYGSGSTSIVYVKRPSISSGSWAVAASISTFGATVTLGTQAQARVLDGYVYTIGTNSPFRIVLRYSSTGAVWESMNFPAAMDTPFPGTADWYSNVVFGDELWLFTSTRYAYSATPRVSASWSTGTMTGLPANYTKQAVAVINSTFFMSGGVIVSTSTYANHVYHSSTGIAWTVLTSNGGFPARSDHSFEAWEGNLVIAGGKMTSPDGSIWESNNGSDWTASVTTLPVYGGVKSFVGPDAPILYGMTSTGTSSTIHTYSVEGGAGGFSTIPVSTIANPENTPVNFQRYLSAQLRYVFIKSTVSSYIYS